MSVCTFWYWMVELGISGTPRRVGTSMTVVVGRTPVVRLSHVGPEDAGVVFVSLEGFNPSGSF